MKIKEDLNLNSVVLAGSPKTFRMVFVLVIPRIFSKFRNLYYSKIINYCLITDISLLISFQNLEKDRVKADAEN